MGIVSCFTNRIDASILVMRGDLNGNAESHQFGVQASFSERRERVQPDYEFATASKRAEQWRHLGGRCKERSLVARALAPFYIVIFCLTMADLTEAREKDMPFDAAGIPATLKNHADSVTCWAIGKRIGQLAPSLNSPRITCERPSDQQTHLAASSSQDWNGFLNKRRISPLPSTISRPPKKAREAKQPTESRRREADIAKNRPNNKAASTAVSLASQLGVERIAVPTSRPLTVSTSEDTRPVPALSLRPDAALFKQPELGGTALTGLALIPAVFAYRRWRKMRAARERIRSEKAIYDAMAELRLEGREIQTSVGAVLQRIEDAFSLCNAFIVLLEPVTREVHHAYSSEHQLPLPMELIEEAVAEIRKLGEEASDITLWHHPGPVALSETVCGKPEGHAPNAVTSIAWLGNRMGAVLIAQYRPARRARPTDTHALQFFTQLLAILIDGHSRPAATCTSSVPVVTAGATGEELTRRIAHEFNNLLVPIMGYAEMAADALSQGSSSRAYVERIQSAGERAKRTVEQMLSVSRKKEAYGSFDIAAATAEILPDLKMCLPASVSLRVILQDGPLLVNGDATALQQAVINLCKNAREAMKSDGTITVSVSVVEQRFSRSMTHGQLTSGCYVRVSVADTGVGIAMSNLKQIFDPYFTTKVGEGGTGLGLSIVLRLVKRLNGQINVRSAPGAGTQFDLFFPCLRGLKPQIPTWPIATAGYAPLATRTHAFSP